MLLKATDDEIDLLETILRLNVDLGDVLFSWHGIFDELILVNAGRKIQIIENLLHDLAEDFFGAWKNRIAFNGLLLFRSESTVFVDAPVCSLGALRPCAGRSVIDNIIVNELDDDWGDHVVDKLMGIRWNLRWVDFVKNVGEDDIKVQLNVLDRSWGLRTRLRMEEVVATAGRSTGWHARHGRAAARVSLSGGLGKTEAGLALCVEGNGLGDSEDSASCESLLEHFFVVFDLLFDFKLL